MRRGRIAALARSLAAVACLATGLAAQAQQELLQRIADLRERGNLALQQAVRDAGSDTRVLLVASHPDDPYVVPAAFLRHALGCRVAVALFTRGEGGQNVGGSETGEALGRIRTLEAEACAARLGIDVRYLNLLDKGFCRTAADALAVWGEEQTERDLARLIRETTPDLVLTTHHPDEAHGHDLGLLTVLPGALRLAADAGHETPGLPPHAVPRAFRGAAEDETPLVTLRTDQVDRVRGETYRDIGYAALQEHRSQHPIRPIDELFELELGFVPVEGSPPAPAGTLVDGLPDLFDRLPATPERDRLARGLDRELAASVGEPETLVGRALQLRRDLVALSGDADVARRVALRVEALDRVLRHAAALDLRLRVDPGAVLVPGQPLELVLVVHNAGQQTFSGLELRAPEGVTLEVQEPAPASLPPGTRVELHLTYFEQPRRAGAGLAARAPNLPPVAPGLASQVPDGFPDLLARSFELPVALEARVTLAGTPIRVALDAPVPRRPAVELEATPAILLVPSDRDEARFSIRVRRNGTQPIEGRLRLDVPPGFAVDRRIVPVRMEHETLQSFTFRVRVPRTLGDDAQRINVALGDRQLALEVHKVDVRVPDDLSVGLVRGQDDTAETVLRNLGVRLRVLRDADLAIGDLDDLDTILVDIRALRGATEARASFPRLLRFAENGGRLVVLYHKDSEFNLEAAGFRGAPRPLRIGKGRVTRRDATVTLLAPEHLLLTTPNPVQGGDWDGWVQERGLYFPAEYDDRYVELLSMHDPGYPEERGSLLYLEHGEGEYVYCALSLYRQMQKLHPGACRLFANLITPRAR